MGKQRKRFVAKAEAATGWRIWDTQQKKWWGELYQDFPAELLLELNGAKSPVQITELIKRTPRKRL